MTIFVFNLGICGIMIFGWTNMTFRCLIWGYMELTPNKNTFVDYLISTVQSNPTRWESMSHIPNPQHTPLHQSHLTFFSLYKQTNKQTPFLYLKTID